MNFGEKLKQIRFSMDLTQDDLAQILGTTKQVISRYELGQRTPKVDVVQEYARRLNIPVEVLTDDLRSVSSFSYKLGYESKAINVYGTIRAGIPTEMIEDIIDTEELPSSMFVGGKDYFGLKVRGDSMSPVYLENDTVIVLKQESCESGNDCIVSINGEDATLKRVRLQEDGAIILQPVNKDYSPRVFSLQQIEELPVKILGVVVEIRRKTI